MSCCGAGDRYKEAYISWVGMGGMLTRAHPLIVGRKVHSLNISSRIDASCRTCSQRVRYGQSGGELGC